MDSNKFTREELDALQGRKTTAANNPYLLGNLFGDHSNKSKGSSNVSGHDRKTQKLSSKEATAGNSKELKKEFEAMTSAVGYKGVAKTKATEVMLMNSKQQEPLTKRERKD
jgi:hypothetical protein